MTLTYLRPFHHFSKMIQLKSLKNFLFNRLPVSLGQTNGPRASSESDLESDEEEAEKSPLPVRAKPRSPMKVGKSPAGRSPGGNDSAT